MKKLNAKLIIPKVKAVHSYQQAPGTKNYNLPTDPTETMTSTATQIIVAC